MPSQSRRNPVGNARQLEGAGKAGAVIAEVHRSLKAGRAIVLLDQYGYDKVPLAVMKQIFGTLKHAEVIQTFKVESVINFLNDKNVRYFEIKTGVMGVMDKALRGPAWRVRVQAGLFQKITPGSGPVYFHAVLRATRARPS